ncbi:arylsulfatase A-like enzyme [Lewinella marina]|uniref:Heparan N-sulfatase n=1 Tax=Neolewinella marina TaxID=438751 RepID=A0A2G0CG20_9BACT|nr:sulfatase [Neolewinella marina]NJB85415.1 arylsulfatase A-like enzyme [Neolewinella marina]PHK98923.1 heparan N-sulfatase [Neolewinella marina]
MKSLYPAAVLLLFGLFTSCGEGEAAGTTDTEYDRPNILFAIADDASWKHFSAYGCDWVSTPAFDRVAAEGLLFNNAYVPNAKCSPSRSCILTGRNSWQLEEAVNHSPYFPEKFITYAEALDSSGYFVGATGKGWAPGEQGSLDGRPRELAGQKFDEYTLDPPAKFISKIDYARNFEDFLQKRPAGEPFCFWYGGTEPHRAYEYGAGLRLTDKNLSDIDEVPPFWPDVDSVRTDMLDYAYEIEYFDGHLGRMIEALEAAGELDNTIIVVTADNGMPFPRIKGQVYEYSNHLPLAIRWPKGIKKAGRRIEDFVNFIDLAPTFMEASGVDPASTGMQPMTGRSLFDIFGTEEEGTVTEERNYVLVGKERHDVGRPNDQGYPVRGIIQGDYLYLRNFHPDRWPVGNPETGYLNTDGSPTKSYLLNTRRAGGEQKWWQLNFGKRVAEELYNIANDPYCLNNLAEETAQADRKDQMLNDMTEKLIAQGDPRMTGNAEVLETYRYSGDPVRDFYNRFMAGEKMKTNWVNDTDFESEPLD